MQPLDIVRQYFGDTITLYFEFLGFYTLALVPLAAAGLYAGHCDVMDHVCALVVVVVAVVVLVWWRCVCVCVCVCL